MDKPGSILDRLLESRIPILAKLAASPAADSVLIAEFTPPEAFHRNEDVVHRSVKRYDGNLALGAEGVLVAAFAGPSAAIRLAVELQRWVAAGSEVRVAVQWAGGAGISQGVLSKAVALVKSARRGQILVNAGARNVALLESGVRCTFLNADTAEVVWEEPGEAVTGDSESAGPYPGSGQWGIGAVPAPVPAVIGDRFEIISELGSGGMGIVYKARDREAGEVVALKVLRPEIASDEKMMQRFRNEVRLARKITHKNVCRIYDLNRFDTTQYISMELVDGETLRDVLKRFGALGLRKGLQVALQICAGLSEAHRQGVIHRDLKPENIMFDRSGDVRIMDFGIARSVETSTVTMAVVGTPAYMAPEQAQSLPVDCRTDIYSLGLILYEVFTGSAPFSGDTPVAVALKQVRERPTPPSKLDPSLPLHVESAILRCLEKDPARRFQSVEELEQTLLEKTFWTPVPRELAASERVPEMLAWQRSDWGLLLCALLSLVAATALFSSVHPAEAFRLSAGPDAGGKLEFESAEYFTLAKEYGGRATHRALKDQIAPGRWTTDTGTMDGQGRPVTLRLPAPILPAEAVRQVFGKDVSSLPQTTAANPRTGDQTHRWEIPSNGATLPEWIEVTVAVSGSTRVSRGFVKPSGASTDSAFAPPRRILFGAPALLAFMLVMFVRRGLHRQAPVPATLRLAAVIGLGAAAGVPMPEYAGPGATAFKIGMPLLSFLVTFVVVHCVITTVLHYGRKRCPSQISGYLNFLSEHALSPPVGLEMFRGILAGVVFAGCWLILLFVLEPTRAAFAGLPYWLQATFRPPSQASYLDEFFPLLIFAETLLVTWILVAFPLTIFAGATRRLPYLLAALAALWVILGFCTAGAMVLPGVGFEAAAAVQAAFLGFVFFKYGITAVGASILTIEVFLLAGPLFRIFERIHPWQHAVPVGVWGLTVIGALLILLGPHLRAAYRRAASMLE